MSALPADPHAAPHQAAFDFLHSRVNYERACQFPYQDRDLQLGRMRELLRRLGNPQDRLRIIHVAGTKGKGSTTVMLAAILSAAGYRTGAFTSPHLNRVEERIAVDGRACTTEEFVALVQRVQPAVLAMEREGANAGPTYFEITTAMALLHFVQCQAEVAVLEVGLGGRLDSTNVCRPEVAVITSISLDHTEQLGTTLEAIAREKGGIIKPGIPVISGVTASGPRQVLRDLCRERGCSLRELQQDFDFHYRPPRDLQQGTAHGEVDFRAPTLDGWAELPGLKLGLLGRHQAANAAVALATLATLRQAGWTIPEEAARRGLAEVVWPARVEIVARRPVIVLDAAHNRASIEALLAVLEESFAPARRGLIFATTQGKDLRGMLQGLVGAFDRIVFTRYRNNPRSVPPEELQALARELGGQDHPICASPAEAWAQMSRWAQADDLICITGSFYLAAEIRLQLASDPRRMRPREPLPIREALRAATPARPLPPGDPTR